MNDNAAGEPQPLIRRIGPGDDEARSADAVAANIENRSSACSPKP